MNNAKKSWLDNWAVNSQGAGGFQAAMVVLANEAHKTLCKADLSNLAVLNKMTVGELGLWYGARYGKRTQFEPAQFRNIKESREDDADMGWPKNIIGQL